jgi:creatinine amidohydrolase
MVLMEELTSKEFDEYRDDHTVVIIPVGALEEHGDHLPLSTDTLQPVHIVQRIEKELEGRVKVLIAPTVPYGMIQSTLNFPGSMSLTFDTLRELLFEIMFGMAKNDIRHIVVLSGHAGRSHMMAMKLAAHRLLAMDEYRNLRIMVLSDYDIAYDKFASDFPKDDGHGGELETSRVLAIRPDLVKGPGIPTKLEMPPYRVTNEAQNYFPTGIWGDPTPATAKKGNRANELIVVELARLIEEMVNEA